MPSLQIIATEDGSQTVLNTAIGSTYHSMHGALTESQHVFIMQGLEKILEENVTNITILEMGFGTGLNALLTALRAAEKNVQMDYHAVELYPVPKKVWSKYELPEKLRDKRPLFETMHSIPWNEKHLISNNFNLTKHHISLLDLFPKEKFDLIYYDAFEPEKQPGLWTEKVFADIFSWTEAGGILTTYCCKGDVRRAMIKAGFVVKKVPGPPGKREMIHAVRPLYTE